MNTKHTAFRAPRAVLLALSLLLPCVLAPARAGAQTPGTPTPVSPPPAPDAQPPASPTTTPPETPAPSTEPAPRPAPDEPRHSHHIAIGLDLGLFEPTSSHARDRFGNSWFSAGIGIGNIQKATEKGRIGFFLTTIYRKKGDNHAFLAPVGIEYRRALARGTDTVPYVGLSGDLDLVDLRSPVDNVHSGLRTSGGGSVFIGTTFSEQGFLEARYIAAGKVKGFDLSGFNLTAGVRF